MILTPHQDKGANRHVPTHGLPPLYKSIDIANAGWLSTTEITTHILTGGDALQSHYNVRVFTRQLQWAMQQCKRILNKEAPIEDVTQSQQSLSVARVQLRAPDDDQGGAPQPADRTPEDDQGGAAQPASVDVEGLIYELHF